MAKIFDYMEFDNGPYVFDAKTYSKEEALEIANKETGYIFQDYTVDDVLEDYVAFRFDPGYCQETFGSNGAYFLNSKGKRGSFKVWVIN